MNEIEPIERMSLVLDAAVHMSAAGLAGVSLDSGRCINDVKLVAVFEHGHAIARDDGHDGESRSGRLPAFRATTGVVVGDVALDADLDRFVRAFADQGSARKVARSLFYAIVDRWVDVNSHGPILLVLKFLWFRTRRLSGST